VTWTALEVFVYGEPPQRSILSTLEVVLNSDLRTRFQLRNVNMDIENTKKCLHEIVADVLSQLKLRLKLTLYNTAFRH